MKKVFTVTLYDEGKRALMEQKKPAAMKAMKKQWKGD